MDDFQRSVENVKDEAAQVLVRKHHDYGPYNIARAPGGPLMGLAVRLHDKLARLTHLLEQGVDPQNESVQDTFLDVENYGTIGQMILRGEWPGVDDSPDTEPEITVGTRVRITGSPRNGETGAVNRIDSEGPYPFSVWVDGVGRDYVYGADELEVIDDE